VTKAYIESFVSHMISKLFQIIADKLDSADESQECTGRLLIYGY